MHWLDFQVLCKRDWMFSEKSLAQPIVEFLPTFHKSNFVTELPHNDLRKKQFGRGRQIDYALFNSKNDKKPIALIESKWAPDSPDVQAIVNDILRLECFSGVTSYFVLAGMKNEQSFDNFDALFKRSKRFRHLNSILPLVSNADLNIKVKHCDVGFRTYYRKFFEEYPVQLPVSFNVKKVFGSEDAHKSDAVYVYIWRIKSSKNRKEFNPETEWATHESVNKNSDTETQNEKNQPNHGQQRAPENFDGRGDEVEFVEEGEQKD